MNHTPSSSSPSAWADPVRAALLVVGAVGLSVAAPQAEAAVIAYDFSENPSNQVLDNTTPKGPLGTSVWNDSNAGITGSLATGSESGLISSTGAATGAAISWSSPNVWWNGSGTDSQEAKVIVGYLDDGANGIHVDLTGIPFANYNVYGILGSDSGDTTGLYTTRDFQINGASWVFGGAGASTASAFGNWGANSANGVWTRAQAGGGPGNYWLVEGLTGSTLSIQGQGGSNGQRGSLGAIIIEEVPEPSSALLGVGAVALLAGRRRRVK